MTLAAAGHARDYRRPVPGLVLRLLLNEVVLAVFDLSTAGATLVLAAGRHPRFPDAVSVGELQWRGCPMPQLLLRLLLEHTARLLLLLLLQAVVMVVVMLLLLLVMVVMHLSSCQSPFGLWLIVADELVFMKGG